MGHRALQAIVWGVGMTLAAGAGAAAISPECSILSRGVALNLSKHATTQKLTRSVIQQTLRTFQERLLSGRNDLFLSRDLKRLNIANSKLTHLALEATLNGDDCTLFEDAARIRLESLQTTRQILGTQPDALIAAVVAARDDTLLDRIDLPKTEQQLSAFTTRVLLKEAREVQREFSQKFPELDFETVAEFVARRHLTYLENQLREAGNFFLDQLLAAFTAALDPHSRYFNPMQVTALKDPGVGITTGKPTPFGMEIQAVAPGTAAAKEGISPKDTLVALDDESVIGWPTWYFELRLASATTLTSTLRVRHPDGSTQDIIAPHSHVVRNQALTQILRATKAGKNIVTVRLGEFYSGVGNILRNALKDELKRGRVDAVLLDLRNNPGGLLEEALRVLGIFVEDGIAAMERIALETDQPWPVESADGRIWSGPLTVLVDRNTASASEIVAGALQDFRRALIFGSQKQTYGKGTVQRPLTFYDGFPRGVSRLTNGVYFLPSGRSPQRDGVFADLVMHAEEDMTDATERDSTQALPAASLSSPIEQPSSPKRSLDCLVLDRTRIVERLGAEMTQARSQFKAPNQKLTADEQAALSVHLSTVLARLCKP